MAKPFDELTFPGKSKVEITDKIIGLTAVSSLNYLIPLPLCSQLLFLYQTVVAAAVDCIVKISRKAKSHGQSDYRSV
jgi:hypothetical protein